MGSPTGLSNVTELPEEVFDGTARQDNQLTELPEEVFDGLTALTIDLQLAGQHVNRVAGGGV